MKEIDVGVLSLEGECEEGLSFIIVEEDMGNHSLSNCLVGRFLCDRPVRFNAMKVRLSEVWRPVKRVAIKEAKPGLYMFRFNHVLDMEVVLRDGPWNFENHMLVVEKLQIGTPIENIPLNHMDF